jgi:acyl-CoA synthetase (AMP-forming)/AMP-acid ligase II/NADP-dependent 3-hydroxy acid dehydrogenase YdfG
MSPAAIAYGGDLPAAPGLPHTLQEALRRAARGERGITYVRAGSSVVEQPYAELLHDAQRVLRGLRGLGLRPGDPVLFQVDDHRSFFTAFWACVLGGFLPSPVAVAPAYREDNAVTSRLWNVWRLLGRPVIITDAALRPPVLQLGPLWDVRDLRVATVEELGGGGEDADWHRAGPGDLVLNLLTSGSTGVPKCVQHRHAAIAAWARAHTIANRFDEHEVTLNWMPLDHVGGLLWALRDVVVGCQHVNARTEAFLARPLNWLDWIHRHRATNTWAPNFAYAMVNECGEEIRRGRWDLSSMRTVLNGAEAVVGRTAHRFLRLLEPHGLPADAMSPCWGMSEISSSATASRLPRTDEAAGLLHVDARTLGGDLVMVGPGTPGAVTFTEVGPPFPGVWLRIVDRENGPLPEDRIGRLQVKGPSVMAGYYANPEANRAAFTADGWFDTGDLAFLHRGSLTITGREKDVIIVNGANYLNHDIESIVEQVEGVQVTWAAACGIFDAGRGSDRLAVFFVPAFADPGRRRRAVRDIRTALARHIHLQPDAVVPVERHEFPKTSSGKVQRSALARDLADGRFDDRLRALELEEEGAGTLPAWFFERTWEPESVCPEEAGRPLPEGTWLVLEDGVELGAELRRRVGGPDRRVVTGRPAGGFARLDESTYALDPGDRAQYGLLLDALGDERERLGLVVHGWCLAPLPAATSRAGLASGLERGALSALWLLQELAGRGPDGVELVVATAGGQWVREGDRLDPARAALPGLVRTAAAEQVLAAVRQVDLSAGDAAACAGALLSELRRPALEPLVAHHQGVRLLPRLRPVAARDRMGPGSGIEPGAVYLLTGGLGGVGCELAQYLLSAYGVRLLILGRSSLEGSPEKAARYRDLQELGAVDYVAGDVADEATVAAAVRRAEATWERPLAGVLHLAGEPAGTQWADLEAHLVRAEPTDHFTRTLHAKVFGTWALARALRERPAAALILFSSVNGYFGGTGFAAYSAANSFLDGFADHWGREEGRPVRCLAWSTWADLGMSCGSSIAAAAERRGFRAIGVAQGLASFLAAMALDRVHLLIGLDSRSPNVRQVLAADQLDEAEVIVAAAGERPYEEPATELERRLAAIWREVLNAGRVGRRDSFFELGGDSLRAARIMARISASLGADQPVQALYEHPTLCDLAAALEAAP